MTNQVAADLQAAADLLERDGWTQGAYHCGTSHCALGAIAVATGYHRMESGPNSDGEWPELGVMVGGRPGAAAEAFAEFVTGDQSPRAVVEWNDGAEGRTANEVIAALRAAADEAERS